MASLTHRTCLIEGSHNPINDSTCSPELSKRAAERGSPAEEANKLLDKAESNVLIMLVSFKIILE